RSKLPNRLVQTRLWRPSPENPMSRKPLLAFLCAGICVSLLVGGAALVTVQGQEAQRFGTWGVDLSARDLSVKPGDNFFRYVNRTCAKGPPPPPHRASIGGFVDLQTPSERPLRPTVDDLRPRPDARLSPEERKLRDFYNSFVDTAAIEAKGLEPA